jgi:hypothetical protein
MMIEITFREFYELKYSICWHIQSKDLGSLVGWNGHIFDGGDFLDGRSSVGEKIVDHLPDSWEWKIQL